MSPASLAHLGPEPDPPPPPSPPPRVQPNRPTSYGPVTLLACGTHVGGCPGHLPGPGGVRAAWGGVGRGPGVPWLPWTRSSPLEPPLRPCGQTAPLPGGYEIEEVAWTTVRLFGEESLRNEAWKPAARGGEPIVYKSLLRYTNE